MLAAGIAIYEYEPTMFHCKYMIVDGLWVSVGSTNMDNRSFRLNDECNLNVIDRTLADSLIKTFIDDKSHAQQVTYGQWKKRPLLDKIIEFIAALFKSQV